LRHFPGHGGILPEKSQHPLEIPLGESFFFGEFVFQIYSELWNDSSAPALAFLPRSDHAADVPVEENHFGIGRECRTVLGGPDAAFDLGEKIAIERELRGECRHQFLALHLTPAISSINTRALGLFFAVQA
jgi:hypothetical protein